MRQEGGRCSISLVLSTFNFGVRRDFFLNLVAVVVIV